MPPRVVKRGAAGPRRTARATEKQQPVLPEDTVKVEEVPVKEEENPAVEDDNKPIAIQDEPKCDISGSVPATLKEEDVNEYVDEYEKDGRLDLEDNEAEYEPEEYGRVDNDDKEIENEDVLEEGNEEDEQEEENVSDEEEVDSAEGEMEDFSEEHEGAEEEVEHAGEEAEQPEMVYVEEDDHHQMFRERRKRKEFEVFVGGLDKDVVEDDLRKVFSQVGEVTEVRLMMNPQTKKNKGFAFLRFATVDQAKQAVTELKNPVINGKQCGVSPSQDSDTLFLGNICKTWTKEALKEKLKHYRVNNVEDLTLVEDSNNEGMNRGFAFLEFSSRSEAMDAFKLLQKREVLFGVDRPVKVSFADSFIDPGGEIMAQVKTVFVDGLSASWDEDRVHKLLKKYGEITKIELARNMPSAKRKDFGFVTFDTHDAAIACAKSINNAALGEGDKKAKVRARLSRPLQRGKGKLASHGDFWSGHSAGQPTRGSRGHPPPRSLPGRSVRGIGSRLPPASVKRHVPVRDRRPTMSMPARARPVPLPPRPPRSYDRMVPVPSYPKSSLKREYGRRDEVLPPRSRAPVDYGSRVVSERRPYRDDYPSRGSGYSDIPKSTSRTAARRPYANDGYGQRFERPPPSYREGHARDYDSVSGSKRPYSAVDDAPPHYADASVRRPRARLDYDLGGGASQYGDACGDRMGRFNLGYGGSRGPISSHDMHGHYKSRQGMGYGGGSYSGSDVGGMYSSSYDSDYMPHGSDVVGGGSYSSIYSGRVVGGRSYMGSGGSRSYY